MRPRLAFVIGREISARIEAEALGKATGSRSYSGQLESIIRLDGGNDPLHCGTCVEVDLVIRQESPNERRSLWVLNIR